MAGRGRARPGSVREAHLSRTRIASSGSSWLAFRDAELPSLLPVGPQENVREKFGSIDPTCFSQAKETLTRTQTVQLKKRATRVEDDVCP